MKNITKHEAIVKAGELAGSQSQPAKHPIKNASMITTEKELLHRQNILSKKAGDSQAES